MHLGLQNLQYQSKAEGLPPPPPPVDFFSWRPTFINTPMPRWKMPVELLPQIAAESPHTVSFDIQEFGNVLYAIVNEFQTWEDHFASRGWQTLEDKINAGFPFWLQPSLGSGVYEEVWDIGSVLGGFIINVDFSVAPIAGDVSITVSTALSLDGITYSAYVVGTRRFADAARYIKFKFEFSTVE